jgi:hypothetical protein
MWYTCSPIRFFDFPALINFISILMSHNKTKYRHIDKQWCRKECESHTAEYYWKTTKLWYSRWKGKKKQKYIKSISGFIVSPCFYWKKCHADLHFDTQVSLSHQQKFQPYRDYEWYEACTKPFLPRHICAPRVGNVQCNPREMNQIRGI